MKLGIAGTGKVVEQFLPVIAELPEIQVTAINSTPKSVDKAIVFQEQYGIDQVFSDYSQFLTEADIDTVYVAVINNLHFPFAKEALLHGKHVICEKPFTMSQRELIELERLSIDYDLVLAEAVTGQFVENYGKIRELLPLLGDIKLIECNFSKYSSKYDSFTAGNVLPAFDAKNGGGALMDLNSSNIHFVVGLIGRPDKVAYYPNIENSIDTSGVLIMDYGYTKAVCMASKDSTGKNGATIQGTKGTIRVNSATNRITSFDICTNDGYKEHFELNACHHKMAAEFKIFANWIDHGDTMFAEEHLAQSLTVMEVLDMAIADSDLKEDPFWEPKLTF